MGAVMVRRSKEEIDHEQRVIATAALSGAKFQSHWDTYQGPWSTLGDGCLYKTQYEAAQAWLDKNEIVVE